MKAIQLNDQSRLYFKRLGLAVDGTDYFCDEAMLRRLQYAHVTTIPYENLDILRGIPLPLDYQSQYEKMILHRRGGYCFELNGLFGGLLRDLGFPVTTYVSRVLRGASGVTMRGHRILRVSCDDGTFLCDAGFGQQAPRYPLALVDGLIQEQFGETYRIIRDDVFGRVIQDLHEGAWRPLYGFTEEVQFDIDFVMPSYFFEHAAASIFNKARMVSIKTAAGRKTIDDWTFREFGAAGVAEITIGNRQEMSDVLNRHFGIDLPPESC